MEVVENPSNTPESEAPHTPLSGRLSHGPARLKTLSPMPAISETQKRVKIRIGLPIRLNASGGLVSVLACADTGSEENIISDELAKSLGYSYGTTSGPQQFMLANGNIVESIGCITTRCSFENHGSDPAEAITCIFHVLLKLAAPLIVGMAFLEETKTLIEHRERLVRFPRPAIQALNVYSVGRPRKQLHCRLNENSVLATPDTGSEVDLISPRFALERGLFTIRGSGEMIEFADGSVALTSGIVQATLQVIGGGNINSSIQSTISFEFLLLDTLVHDVLIGEDSLEELRVFTQNQNSLYPVSDMTGPLGLNSIRYLGAIDRTLKWVKENLAVKTQESQIISQYPNFSLLTTCSLLTHSLDPVSSRFHKDQQENSRREYEATRIAHLPENERRFAIATEAERQAQCLGVFGSKAGKASRAGTK